MENSAISRRVWLDIIRGESPEQRHQPWCMMLQFDRSVSRLEIKGEILRSQSSRKARSEGPASNSEQPCLEGWVITVTPSGHGLPRINDEELRDTVVQIRDGFGTKLQNLVSSSLIANADHP